MRRHYRDAIQLEVRANEVIRAKGPLESSGPSGGETDEDEGADEDDPIPLRHNTVSDDECPTGLCLESKPTCTRSGGKVVQVKPRDKDSKDLTMRCCGVQKCKMPEKDTVCPPGLCMSSKPGCANRGGKIVQVKPRDPKSDDTKCDAVVRKSVKCHRLGVRRRRRNAQPGYAWKANQHAHEWW